MSSKQKDIVDRLGDLTHMLKGVVKSKNKIDFDYKLKNANKKRMTKTPHSPPKNKQIPMQYQNFSPQEKTHQPLIDFPVEITHNPVEIANNPVETIFEEEEEEYDDQNRTFSFEDNESSVEYNDNNDQIIQDVIEEEEDNDEEEEEEEAKEEKILTRNSPPIKAFTIRNIKSDTRSFSRYTYFKRWQRALRAKQIQKSIENKMNKYKKSDKKSNDIYSPCYDPFFFKKINLSQKKDVLERLSKPRYQNSQKTLQQDNQQKNQNIFIIPKNSQYQPKTEEEKKRLSQRQYIRQIEYERDQREQSSKQISKKELKKTIKRLLETRQQNEEEPEKPKSCISSRQQLQVSLRLAVPKKEIEEPEEKSVNKFILPTKKEQLEISTRLAQPKPDFSPKPIRQKRTITLAEQREICERLSSTNTKKKPMKKSIEDDSYKLTHNTKKRRMRTNKKKVNCKKKIKKHTRRKTNVKLNNINSNAESTTILPNNSSILPSASPVPTRAQPASPMFLNTPKKVRFNRSTSNTLSRLVNEALGQVGPDDDTISSPRNDHNKHQRNRSQTSDLSCDEEFYQYRFKYGQTSQEIQNSSINQNNIFDFSGFSSQKHETTINNQNKETIHYPSSENSEEQDQNQGKIFNSHSFQKQLAESQNNEEIVISTVEKIQSQNNVETENQIKLADNDEKDQEEFHFESTENYKFLNQEDQIIFEEEEEDIIIQGNLNNDSEHRSLHLVSSSSSKSSLKDHRSLISQAESETLKEIDVIESSNNSKIDQNFELEEEEDIDDDEIKIVDNISGIQTPIQGLVSTSDLDVNIFSKSQDSIQDIND